jgi:hypothetical protein
MSSNGDDEGCAYFVILGILILGSLISWPIFSAFEANAYRNATGHHVSTWDAMWLDLRVQAEPQYKKGE